MRKTQRYKEDQSCTDGLVCGTDFSENMLEQLCHSHLMSPSWPNFMTYVCYKTIISYSAQQNFSPDSQCKLNWYWLNHQQILIVSTLASSFNSFFKLFRYMLYLNVIFFSSSIPLNTWIMKNGKCSLGTFMTSNQFNFIIRYINMDDEQFYVW